MASPRGLVAAGGDRRLGRGQPLLSVSDSLGSGITLLFLQAYVDLGILTVLLHFSGGIENPLSTIMLFHVIIGGILLSRRQCYGMAAVGSLLFALMAWLKEPRLWSTTR